MFQVSTLLRISKSHLRFFSDVGLSTINFRKESGWKKWASELNQVYLRTTKASYLITHDFSNRRALREGEKEKEITEAHKMSKISTKIEIISLACFSLKRFIYITLSVSIPTLHIIYFMSDDSPMTTLEGIM